MEAAGYHTRVKRSASPRPGPRVVDRPPDLAPDTDGPSKSQRKREMHALQDLGETLVELQPAVLRTLDLPEDLLEAIALAQRIHSREGRRRQLQLIGKLMRRIDPAPIRDALAKDGSRHREEVALMHSAEHWRERLLREAAALQDLAQRHPLDDPAHWRGLIDGARAEQGSGQPGRRYRELYRALHALLGGAPAGGPATGAPPSEDSA